MEDPLEITVRKGPRLQVDSELERSSDAYYHFLAGQMALHQEAFDKAQSHLEKSSNLTQSPSRPLHLSLAELYVRKGSLEKALSETQRALQADSGDIQALRLEGELLEALDREDEALAVFERILNSIAEKPLPLVVRVAGLYCRKGRFSQAEQLLSTYRKERPNEPAGYYYLSGLYELQGRLDDAEKVLADGEKQGTTAAAGEKEALNSLIRDRFRLLLKQDKERDAREVAKKILGKKAKIPENVDPAELVSQLLRLPEDADSLGRAAQVLKDKNALQFHVGLLHFERQELKEAERSFVLLLVEDPNQHRARYYLASVQAALGYVTEAAGELTLIPSGSPLYLQARAFAALLLKQKGNLRGAETVLREALKEEPKNRELRSHLVIILREQQRNGDAKNILNELIQEASQSADTKLMFSYAATLHELGERAEAISLMETILQRDPDLPDALNFVAYALAEDTRELSRAEEMAKRAIELNPNDGYYIDTLGWIYFRQGRYQEAEEQLERAVHLTSHDIVILEHYGDVLMKNGKRAKAREVYERLLKEAPNADTEDEKKAVERVRSKLSEFEKDRL